jgi:hypothetical protein
MLKYISVGGKQAQKKKRINKEMRLKQMKEEYKTR